MRLLLILALITSARAQATRTFDNQTRWELAAAAASLGADAYTSTSHAQQNYYRDYNPIAEPFLRSESKTAAYFTGSLGLLVGGNYLLRRHPRWKHVLNWSTISVETYWSIHNARVR